MTPIEEFLIQRFTNLYGKPKSSGLVDEIVLACAQATPNQARKAAAHIIHTSKWPRWPTVAEVIEAIENAPRTRRRPGEVGKVSYEVCHGAWNRDCQCPRCLAPARSKVISDVWLLANAAIVDEARANDWYPELASELRERSYQGAIAEWAIEHRPPNLGAILLRHPEFDMGAQVLAICDDRARSNRPTRDKGGSIRIQAALDRVTQSLKP